MGKKGKGKSGVDGGDKDGDKAGGAKGKQLKTCNHVKARHILCEKQGKLMEAYKELCDGWLDNGDRVPPGKFGEVAMKYSECSSAKRGGDLGWFPRGKMEGVFQGVAFSTAEGDVSQPFKGANGWHVLLVEGRKA
mmetsp:Transcript_449/g.1168  ORF Transcript_449/g.1168 Transcript_449/m.1168 type:complete len:135 (-) Transcript_449:31-435(-)